MTKEQISRAVDDWFQRKCRAGALARDTDAYNQVFLAKDDLKASLCELLAPQTAAAAPAASEASETHTE